MCEVIFLSLLNEYSKMCYHSWLEKKERAYQLISQQIPEGKVLQRNNWFVKCPLTIQTSSLKMSDCWNVRMFGSLQISFWNTNSRNTSYKNTSFWNTSFWNTSVVVVVVVVVVCGTGTGINWSGSEEGGTGYYLVVLSQYGSVLVGTWWYWVNITGYRLVLSGTWLVYSFYACLYWKIWWFIRMLP